MNGYGHHRTCRRRGGSPKLLQAAPKGHIALAISHWPAKVIAPLQRVYEGWDFDEHVYEAMFQRGFLYASVIGHIVPGRYAHASHSSQ